MLEALILGTLAQSSLFLSGLLVYWVRIPTKVVGVLAGFGAGALISAISFDLIPEAEAPRAPGSSSSGCSRGRRLPRRRRIVERRFGDEGTGGAMGIVVGSVVDGVPESIIFGIQIADRPAGERQLPRRRPDLQRPPGDRPLGRPGRAGWSAARTRTALAGGCRWLRRGGRLGYVGATACRRRHGDRAWRPWPPAGSWRC